MILLSSSTALVAGILELLPGSSLQQRADQVDGGPAQMLNGAFLASPPDPVVASAPTLPPTSNGREDGCTSRVQSNCLSPAGSERLLEVV